MPRNALLVLLPMFYIKDSALRNVLMDTLTTMENVNLVSKGATFAIMLLLARNVFLLLTFQMIKELVPQCVPMDLLQDKEDAHHVMLINAKHAIPPQITARNASFQELYWIKNAFLLAHPNYSTGLRMVYLARNAQLDVTRVLMIDVYHVYQALLLTMTNAQIHAQLDK
jgi:hypothetical protein